MIALRAMRPLWLAALLSVLPLGALALLLALVYTLPAGPVHAQTPSTNESCQLGRIVTVVGSSGELYGYDSGSYGTLKSGEFPGGLFNDGNSRAVDAIYEDAAGSWHLVYSGGATDDWTTNQAHLDETIMEVSYESGEDSRRFVLGGFIAERVGTSTLKLTPPLPSTRDWDARSGEEIAIAFDRCFGQPTRIIPDALTDPTATPDSFIDFLKRTTPGGPVTFQMMVTILVYAMFLYRTPATPQGMVMCAIVLVLTPWGPAIIGFGDLIAASIVLINVIAGGYAYGAYRAAGTN